VGDLEKIYIAGIDISRIGNHIFIKEPRAINEVLVKEIENSDISDGVTCRIIKGANPGLLTIEPSELAKEKDCESNTIHMLLSFLAGKVQTINLDDYRQH
ncbi:MAG: hypothetical protein ABIC57_03350, partial [bacterium]